MGHKILLFLLFAIGISFGIFLDENQTSGQIYISDSISIFYWHFASRSLPETDSIIFSLQGGPGTSSLLSVFMGNGPYKINEDLSLSKNQLSWNNNANVIYVDQPVGTGLSQAQTKDMATNLEEVGQDFFSFLLQFYDLFPQYKNRKLFLEGESYAGHYLSSISKKILEENQDYLKLEGILIISGWVNPLLQESSQLQYALKMNLLSQETFERYLLHYQNDCIMNILLQSEYKYIQEDCKISFFKLIQQLKKGTNLYNINKPCNQKIACLDVSLIEKFLKIDEVKEQLKINKEWIFLNEDVYQSLLSQEYLDVSQYLEFALEKDIKIVAVYGDKDLITNYIGGEKWISNLNWRGKQQFNNQNYEDYILEGINRGQVKSAFNLKFILVKDSGHSLPIDQPSISFSLFESFISDS